MTDLLQTLAENADRVALCRAGVEYTYAALVTRIREARNFMRQNDVQPHDCVVLRGDFTFDSIAFLLALSQSRNIIAPVTNPTQLAWEALHQSCAPVHLIDCSEAPKHQRIAERQATEPALLRQLREGEAAGLILLSSGSTGRPKVILHDLGRLILGKLAQHRHARLSIVLFLLFDHVGGINTLLNTLLAGSTAYALTQRTPDEVCALIQKHRIRILPTSPTFLNLILVGGFAQRYDLSSLKLISYGTEPMPDTLLARVRDAFPRARLLQTFGTSETGISGTVSESSRSTYFKIDDALFEHRIVDGELHLRSRTQFLGYLNQETTNVTEDGWFLTGDMVEQGLDGYLRIRGRVSELINVGGEKVLPLEVESVLLSSPFIEDCVVYGEPNAITGQHVCAEVKPKGAISKGELRDHVQQFLRERLEPFKVPVRIKSVEEIRRSERFKKTRAPS